ncbi:MAG: hypothetical protein HUU54_06245 [Ignavibacteriaceae bacterium]|nr:hypothetical protein [Ignavibacteriaceae bacterium]
MNSNIFIRQYCLRIVWVIDDSPVDISLKVIETAHYALKLFKEINFVKAYNSLYFKFVYCITTTL